MKYEHGPTKVSSGTWEQDVSWELYKSSELPPAELCTAVFCLALHDDGVVLTRTKRGWEMLGGHIETGETVEEALFREAHEEGGFTPEEYQLFGHKKLTAPRPVPSSREGIFYPFPTGYVVYFVAKSSLPLEAPHGDEGEILESRAFTLEEIAELDSDMHDIITIGLEAAANL
jgi:8-oxo-dGTP pyrophosphatase MutT (NUDIX family)